MEFILPDWPASQRIQSLVTTRLGGVSEGPYESFNTALHVGDVERHVEENRAALKTEVGGDIQWLRQVHGSEVEKIRRAQHLVPTADAVYTSTPGLACAIHTADCLPILICDINGTEVAAAHAGWRGLAAGIVGNTVRSFCSPAAQLMAWLGPAISVRHFAVGVEVLQHYRDRLGQLAITEEQLEGAFHRGEPGKYRLDLYALARAELKASGVLHVYGGEFCTFSDESRFFSYRRDGVCGRMASVIRIR